LLRPNCEAIEEDDRVFIYAMRDIEPGQELFYDYALEIDEPITEELMQEFRMSLWRRMLPRHNARIEIKKGRARVSGNAARALCAGRL